MSVMVPEPTARYSRAFAIRAKEYLCQVFLIGNHFLAFQHNFKHFPSPGNKGSFYPLPQYRMGIAITDQQEAMIMVDLAESEQLINGRITAVIEYMVR